MADIETARVFIGMPRYGDISTGASRGLYCPTRGAVQVWKVADACNSLTQNSFNDLFAIALDMRDAGLITHFAMIHADVEPEGAWLDELWAELVGHGADLVSAVIPIKEDKDDVADPATSAAIGDALDPWKVNRRIRVSERDSLPETFGQADVCGPDEVLLVNTGLWLTDLRCQAWENFPGFQIPSGIGRRPDGKRYARCRSEDWEMSRYLHSCGAKVMATWRVRLGHRGTAVWRNY